jgi:hypothetical protein
MSISQWLRLFDNLGSTPPAGDRRPEGSALDVAGGIGGVRSAVHEE